MPVDSRFYCEMEKAKFRLSEHPSRMFGMEMNLELEENRCKTTTKLK